MTITKALATANKRIAELIDKTLDTDVKTAVMIEEMGTINEVVYKAYKRPVMYERRGSMGGLADFHNIEHTVKDGTLHVFNTAEPNPGGVVNVERVTTGKYLDMLIEYGDGGPGGFYDFPKRGAAYMRPRPFTQKTIEHLKEDKLHVNALRQGLQRRGVNVR